MGIYPEKTTLNGTCTPVFIETIFTIARMWKQPRCPSTEEWIKKLWYIYTMEYYSAIKVKEYESIIVRWMNLDLLYKVSEKQISYINAICGI